jgi:hypothetical protein
MTQKVLDPAFTFNALNERMQNANWQLSANATNPIVAGEPEHAVFEHLESGRVFYTYNPACQLRVLDCSSLSGTVDLSSLPIADLDAIREWLASDDEQTILRGILAANIMNATELIDFIELHCNHPSASIATAAAHTALRLQGKGTEKNSATDIETQTLALANAKLVKQLVTPLLLALCHDHDGTLSATLRPRPEDYARVFQPEAVDASRVAYEAVWATPLRIISISPDSRLECHVAPASMLSYDNNLSWHFPGGYRTIASLLNPHCVWVAWKMIPPSQSAGMAYNGLVWIDDHWAWFPKPYRVLSKLVDATQPSRTSR